MAKIKFRRDTAAAWTQVNPTLAQGEPGFEHDTGLLKIGDGETAWADLAYLSGSGDTLSDDREVKITVGNTEYWAIVNRANNNDNGVEASAVAYDSDDNMITLHVADGQSGDDLEVLVISKFDAAANLLWQKQINNNADTSIAHDVCVDSNDNIVVAFSSDDTLQSVNNSRIDSIVILKLDSSGGVIWQKDYQGNVLVSVSDTDVDIYSDTVATTTFGGNAAQSIEIDENYSWNATCLLYTSPSPRDRQKSRMPSSA